LLLLDTPGFYLPMPLLGSAYLGRDELESVHIKTRIHPIRHALCSRDVGFLGGFCRIDVQSADDAYVPFQLFMRSSVPYFKKPTGVADAFFQENHGVKRDPPPSLAPPFFFETDARRQVQMATAVEFEIPANESGSIFGDVVFGGGLGWISFGHAPTSPAKVRVSTPGGIGAVLRTVPIRRNFL
jgi:hypothetical protein